MLGGEPDALKDACPVHNVLFDSITYTSNHQLYSLICPFYRQPKFWGCRITPYAALFNCFAEAQNLLTLFASLNIFEILIPVRQKALGFTDLRLLDLFCTYCT